MRSSIAPLLALAVATVSCANTDELRVSDPLRTGEFPGEYRDFTACVAYELAGRFSVDQVVRDSPQIGTVSHTIESPFYRLTNFEVSVRQQDADIVQVEVRARSAIGPSWTDAVWPSVERCATG